ncbi:MAG: hypothetical protein DCC71_10470 [Proteobacteria bacterium]|nr:MAG: hypothetical protein DCC71_10470 [Pseudomonadota bacterium]
MRASAVATAALVTLVALTASAQQAARLVGISMTVSHASERPGPMDPNAAALDRQLRQQFRYESLRVIERRHMQLRMQEVGGMDLPTGKRVQLRPLSLTPSGVLISVDIPGTLQTDVRVPNRKQVVIGVERYDHGKLIVTLQPDY